MLVAKVLHSELEGSRFKPHYQDVKKNVYLGAISSKLGNSKTHKKNNCLIEIKKFLKADNYFMENLAPSRNSHFCYPGSYYHQSVTLW